MNKNNLRVERNDKLKIQVNETCNDFTLKQVRLTIDVKMFDWRDTIEPMTYDYCSRKSWNRKERNQITHDILFPYSMAELAHRSVNGNACNKK